MRRVVLLLLLLGAAGWFGLRHQGQQSRMHQQLAQLTAMLTIENDRVAEEARNSIKGIEAEVLKNHNHPADRALLYRAEALQLPVNQLTDALHTYRRQLRRATGSLLDTVPLQHPGAAITAGAAGAQGTLRHQALAQQLAAYVDTLRQLGLVEAHAAPLLLPAFDKATPVVEALAALSQLESDVLAHQRLALQGIAEAVSVPRWFTQPLVTATAKSNVVAPGDTYRAQLGLASYYSAARVQMRMTCNGRPVPIGPNGTGLVRFRAPTRPGPATWTGTISIKTNGRDTTFKVVVPYYVVRR